MCSIAYVLYESQEINKQNYNIVSENSAIHIENLFKTRQ